MISSRISIVLFVLLGCALARNSIQNQNRAVNLESVEDFGSGLRIRSDLRKPSGIPVPGSKFEYLPALIDTESKGINFEGIGYALI